MEFQFIFVIATCIFLFNVYGTIAREVTIYSSDEQSFGRNSTLQCTFIKQSNEELISVAFLARNFTKGTYEILVSFRPAKNPVVTDFGDYLSINTSTDITLTSTEASIMLNNISCLHQRGYKCRLAAFLPDGSTPATTESNALNFSVEVPPSKPNDILLVIKINETANESLWTEATAIANANTTVFSSSDKLGNGDFLFSNATLTEGDIVTFLCSGIVGQPTRNYLWQRIDQSGNVTEYTDVSTKFNLISGECYYNGTSEFTHTVTAKDNNSKMRCFVENMTELYSTTSPLTIYYKVRKPTITKHPDQNIYDKETTTLILNCSADGNPQPSILWKKNGEILGNMNVLEIKNLTINESGTYECLANNSVQNEGYTKNSSVNITIVEEIVTTTPAPTEKPTYSEPVTEASEDKDNSKTIYVVIGVVVPVVVITITTIVCILKKRNSNVYKRTSEVNVNCDNQNNRKPCDPYSSINLEDNPKTEKTKGNPYDDNRAHNLAYLKHEEESELIEKNLSDQPVVYAVVNKPKNKNLDNEDTVTEDPYVMEQEGVYDKAYDRRHKPDENSESFDTSTDKTRQSNLQKNTNEHEQFKETTEDGSSYENKAFSDDIIKEKRNENENSTETTAENNSNEKTSL